MTWGDLSKIKALGAHYVGTMPKRCCTNYHLYEIPGGGQFMICPQCDYIPNFGSLTISENLILDFNRDAYGNKK